MRNVSLSLTPRYLEDTRKGFFFWKSKMKGILLSCFLTTFLLHAHHTEVSISKETNTSSANDDLIKTTTTTPTRMEDLFQYEAEGVDGKKYLKDEENIPHSSKKPENQDRNKKWRSRESLEYEEHIGHLPHPRKQTKTIYPKNKLKTRTIEPTPKHRYHIKKGRRCHEVGPLETGAQHFTRDTDQSKHTFTSDMNSPKTKTKTTSMSEPNKELGDHPQIKDDASLLTSYMREYQQESVMRQVRSPRQRRTAQAVHTPEGLICQGELSCRSRCQHPRNVVYEVHFSCFCDEDCEFFHDCCADYDAFCSASAAQSMTNSTTQNRTTVENLVTQENRDLWKCYKGQELEGTDGVWMIGSCPRSWPEDDVMYRCRNLSETNEMTEGNYRYLPVYTSNGRVYHNRFCALCNGVSPKDLKEFSIKFECDFTPPKHLSFNATISYYFTFCKENFGRKLSYWSPEKGHPRRYCIRLIPSNICRKQFSGNITFTKCVTGKPRIVTGKSFYENIDCAICDSYQIDEISCGPNITASIYNTMLPGQLTTPPKPFSVILDFNNDNANGPYLMEIQTRCPAETVFDHYLGVCKSTIQALPRLSDLYEYLVVLWTEPLPDGRSYDSFVYRQAIAQALTVSVPNIDTLAIYDNISFTLQIRKNERKQEILQNLLDFTTPFKLIVTGKVYTVVKATSRIVSCVNRQKYFRSEYSVLQDGSSAVYIKNTGEIFQSTEYYINTTESISANDSQAIFVCRLPQISNCSGVYILINEGDFRVLMNKSIFVNASKQVYDQSEYTWINKSVGVCSSLSNTYYKSKKVSTDDPVLTTITIVCMSLSIIGLVFVLVTYSLFSELRTLPGINLMNLSVSILMAQLLWLLGSGQTDTPMACTVIAVILHYLFLVSFLWTSIIAFDTWRAFSAKSRPSDSKRDKCIKAFRHMAVGWVPGLAYVSICVALDVTDTVNIGYKSRVACWMANKWAILYFFAIPVFMFLAFNTVFYVLTFRAIKTTAERAREALLQDTKKNFGIYLRIASLMGFTWIFGFAAPFGWQFLWYPFVILNGLQGAYIALAFALNKRARGLYKSLLQRSKPQPRQATSLSNLAKTNTQETICNKESLDISL